MKTGKMISLDEAKHALRVSGNYDDELISGLIAQAEGFAKKYIGKGFLTADIAVLKPAILLHIGHMYEGNDGVPRAALEVYNQYKILRV